MPLTTPLLTVFALALGACASHPEDRSPTTEPPADVAAPKPDKGRAPVELTLAFAPATLSLTVRATAPIPRAVVRFTLPPEVTTGAPTEQDLGALAADEVRVVTLPIAVVRLPATITAGVDCHLATGVKLYSVTTLDLGPEHLEPASPPTHGPNASLAPRGSIGTTTGPRRDLSRHGLRAHPARRVPIH